MVLPDARRLSGKMIPLNKPAFWNNAKRYYDLKSYWRNRFGCTVYKLPIDAGFTCPNRNGAIATGGCLYCDGRGSRLRQEGPLPAVAEQIKRGQTYYRQQRQAGKFIAYFQTFTNTYGPRDKLKKLYDEALAQEDVIGLSIGTRPDCVSEEVLELLADYGRRVHIWLEFGLQSIHDRTLEAINRGHNYHQFLDAITRSAGRNILICVHVIVGLPGESRADVLATAKALAALPIDGIKIHLLLALRGTVLGELHAKGQLAMIEKEEYVQTVCDMLELLPPGMVIQRLTADGYRDVFLAPAWAAAKMEVLNAIDRELEIRGTFQGSNYQRK